MEMGEGRGGGSILAAIFSHALEYGVFCREYSPPIVN